VAKESDFLLPGLLAGGVGLARLLDQMHCRTEAAPQAPAAGNAPAGIAGAASVPNLAPSWPAPGGEAGRAGFCVGVGGTSRARPRGPGHGAARDGRRVTGAACRGHAPGTDPGLDVHRFAPARRHESIFPAYHALSMGAVSCSSTTTSPGRCATSSTRSIQGNPPGTTLRPARRFGACASAGLPSGGA
jgi:hypothetical protein